jgi:hypothetical protein
MFKNIIELERDQVADCARIDAAIRLAERDFATLDSRHFDPEEVRRKWTIIRDRTILAIRDVRRNIAQRASEASQALLIEKLYHEAADCVDDGAVREFSAMLQDIPTKRLLDHLRYLVHVGDLARIQSVRAAFGGRDDRHRFAAAFDKILGQLALAGPGNDLARLARICRLAEELDARIAQLLCAQSIRERSCARAPQRLAPGLVPEDQAEAFSAVTMVDYARSIAGPVQSSGNGPAQKLIGGAHLLELPG